MTGGRSAVILSKKIIFKKKKKKKDEDEDHTGSCLTTGTTNEPDSLRVMTRQERYETRETEIKWNEAVKGGNGNTVYPWTSWMPDGFRYIYPVQRAYVYNGNDN